MQRRQMLSFFDGLVLHFYYRHCLNGWLPRLEVDSIADLTRGFRSDAAPPPPSQAQKTSNDTPEEFLLPTLK